MERFRTQRLHRFSFKNDKKTISPESEQPPQMKTASSQHNPGQMNEALENLIECFGDGVFILDLDGRVLFANRAGASFFGRSTAEMRGYDYGIPRVFNESQEIPIIQLDGTLGAAETRATPTEWNGAAAYLITMRNITDQARLHRELLNAKQHAESASIAKSEFLSSMSHELRTPLNSILVLSQLLSENPSGRLSAKELEYAQTIYKSGRDLLSLISDVLDISKIEAGRMELHLSDFNLRMLIDNLARAMEPLALVNRNSFHVIISDAVPRRIQTDPQRFEQILRNLLSNAFKFTKEGSIRLNLDVLNEPSVAPTLVVQVVDTGIGIAEDQLELIFQSFMQAGGNVHRRYSGTGLGLTLSRKFAEALGGSIHVASREGAGSTFELRLPLRSTSSSVPAPPDVDPSSQLTHTAEILLGRDETPAESYPDLHGRAILVVDDDMRTVFALSSLLEEFGCSVTWTESGDRAIAHLKSGSRVDAVLLDIQMPVKNGFETLSEIRRDHRFDTVPILAVTASVLEGDRERCLVAGAVDYIPKPVNVPHLLQRLRYWIAQADAMQTPSPPGSR